MQAAIKGPLDPARYHPNEVTGGPGRDASRGGTGELHVMSDTEPEATSLAETALAYHTASHEIVARLLGVQIDSAPSPGSERPAGCCLPTAAGARPLHVLLVCVAGPIAEVLATGNIDRSRLDEDLRRSLGLLERVTGDLELQRELAELAWVQADLLLRRHWHLVEAVAVLRSHPFRPYAAT